MRFFSAALALALIISPVFAQNQNQGPRNQPEEPMNGEVISPVETIRLVPGQAKLIKFNRMIGDVQTSVNNVVRASVLGDKVLLSIAAVSAGATDMTVVNQYGEMMYIVRVIVSPGLSADGEEPHVIRTYGWSETKKSSSNNGTVINITNGDSKTDAGQPPDFVDRLCSSTGCSQPLNPAGLAAGLDKTDAMKRN
ncbi:pilus assembly protein N-terminal domain-containing protein [Bradyrhizobium elkanii]|uniref:pilus assembly protein N-terminal domain-containing protein n=1 Tax=Bradyrhizobium elkanii TaxID=29448 RepID=UPI003512FB5D